MLLLTAVYSRYVPNFEENEELILVMAVHGSFRPSLAFDQQEHTCTTGLDGFKYVIALRSATEYVNNFKDSFSGIEHFERCTSTVPSP